MGALVLMAWACRGKSTNNSADPSGSTMSSSASTSLGSATHGMTTMGSTSTTNSGGRATSGGAGTTAGNGNANSMGSSGGTGGTEATAGSGGSSGAAGAGNDDHGFVDPEGDATPSELDILAGGFYDDGTTIEIRVQFAGEPLSDGASLSIESRSWRIEVMRYGAGFSVRLQAPGLSVGLDPCTHLAIAPDTGWLVLRMAADLVSVDANTTLSISATAPGADGDSVVAVPWVLLPYPGPVAGTTLACQPWNTARTSTVAFLDISLGNGFGCGVTLEAEVLCWGEAMALATLGNAPAGPFKEVSISSHVYWEEDLYACGLRSEGLIECWGGAPPTLPGSYRTLGDPFGCAIRDNGDLACINLGTGGDEIESASGPIAKVVGAGTQECHLTEAGQIACLTEGMAPPGNDFVDLAFGSLYSACGLRAAGTLDCDLASALPYPLASIDAGGSSYSSFPFGCGLTEAGSPICWGGAGITAPVQPGPFERLEVSSTTEGICGFRADSTLSCWHYSYVAGFPEPATTPP